MRRVLAACGGFLLAVLWFDLMFDVQVLHSGADVVSEDVLASVASYYRRVTTEAYPMNRLIGGVMVLTLGGSVYELARRHARRWREAAALVLCAVPIVLAAVRVVPNAVRLGTRTDSVQRQSELARAICYDHLFCVAALSLFVLLQLSARPRPGSGAPPA
jgi:DMSO reductase anchor subunit